MWHIAQITNGVPSNGSSFATGRHVYFSKTITGRVRVIGAGRRFAVLTLDAAKAHLKSCRDGNGKLFPARQQVKLEIAWQSYEARRFTGHARKIAA